MAETFNLKIVTPRATEFNGKAISLTVPGEDGSFGILANHTPLTASLSMGHLNIKTIDNELRYENEQGILEVNEHHDVLILVDKVLKQI